CHLLQLLERAGKDRLKRPPLAVPPIGRLGLGRAPIIAVESDYIDVVVSRVVSRNSIPLFRRHGVRIGAKDPANIVGSLRSKLCDHVTIRRPISSWTIGAEFRGSTAPMVTSEIHLVPEAYKHQLPKLVTSTGELFQIEVILPGGN